MSSASSQLLRGATLLAAALVVGSCSRLSATGPFLGGGSSGGGLAGGTQAVHVAAGLVSLVPDARRARAEWRLVGDPATEGELRLYLATDPAQLLDGRVEVLPAGADHLLLEDLPEDREFYASLGILPTSGGPARLLGPTLSARTGAPVFVTPGAPGAGADGTSPATAFPNLFIGVLTAQLAGGGNVWVSEGTLAGVAVPVLAGVSVYGGFPADFDLAERDVQAHETVLEGLAGESVLTLDVAGAPQRVDGLTLDGLGVASNGLDLDRTPAQLTHLVARRAGRGMRLRAPELDGVTEVLLVDVVGAENDLEGLSVAGPFQLEIEACVFHSNGQEGVEFGPWIAPSAETIHLRVRDSRFSDNATEGLDVDMLAPSVLGTPGRFELELEDCEFERNGTDGCLVDIDYETAPGWSSGLVLRGSRSRANAGHGYSLDLDGPFDAVLHRLEATANGAHGVNLTSETFAAHALLSASAFIGNRGVGVSTSLGNVGAALSHCVLLANREGGVRAEVRPAMAFGVASHLQAVAFTNTVAVRSPLAPAASAPFAYGPLEVREAQGLQGNDLILDRAPSVSAAAAELAGDGVARSLDAPTSARLTLDPVPAAGTAFPTTLALFATEGEVDEDWHPSGGSPFEGTGPVPPGGAATDAGPFGGAVSGAPGVEGLTPPTLFRAATTVPAWGSALAPTATFRVRFAGGSPDPATLAAGLRLVDAAGATWPLDAEFTSDELVVQPPAGGWTAGDRLELHATLLSTDGTPCLPVSLPVGPFQP